MDAEIQRRRTFEVISKWIGKHNGVTIDFQPNAVPCADPKTRRIVLPSNLKVENLDKVIALVFHEAGHIAHSTFDMKKLIDNPQGKDVLNGCEDVRVDTYNIDYLPRIREFYEALVKWEDETADPAKVAKIPIPVLALLDAMRMCNEFYGNLSKDPKVSDFLNKHNITGRINCINQYLNVLEHNGRDKEYAACKKLLDELIEIIYGKIPPQPKPPKGNGKGEGQGQGQGEPEECSGDQPSNDSGDSKGEGKGKEGGKEENPSNGKGGFGCGNESSLWEIDPNAHYALDDMSLTEQTVQAFNELLTVKSTRTIIDGSVLDTNNLTAFFTGAVDELFKEVKVEKHKKSKIMFLLDSSGSMMSTDGMCDNNYKTQTLITIGNKLTSILKEIQETEGINVDFVVRGFDTNYHVWDNDTWQDKYAQAPGGSTNCVMGFKMAQEEILADKTIDGNKMVIMITDGQVDEHQIHQVKDMIVRHSSDVKCMILGIGLSKEFEVILGGHNIIAKELADGVILGAIQTMLDD